MTDLPETVAAAAPTLLWLLTSFGCAVIVGMWWEGLR